MCGGGMQMEVEVRQQAQRLNWHPSVCVWGGNNEVEAAFEWFPASRDHGQRYFPAPPPLFSAPPPSFCFKICLSSRWARSLRHPHRLSTVCEASVDWSHRYAVDFDALFCQSVRKALADVDPALPYLDSSPSNGLLCSDPWVKR